MRQVRDPRREVRRLLLELAQLRVELLHAVAQLAHLGDRAGGVGSGLLELGDVLARGVPPGLQLLGLVQHRQAALLELVEAREVQLDALQCDAGLDLVPVLAQEFRVVHGVP